MIPRVRSAGIAFLAVLAVASPCLAAGEMAPGRGGIGGQFGGSVFLGDGDYSRGARPRLAFAGHYRYVINGGFRWQVAPGFTWTTYSGAQPMPVPDGNFPQDVSKRTNMTLLLPVSLQLQYLVRHGPWHYHVGAGPGVYRVWVVNRRQVLVDPVSFRAHRGLYAGASGEVGVERFLKALPSTSLELTVAAHWVFAQRDEQFPVGYNSTLAAGEIRLGGNYYFDLGRLKKKEPTELPPPGR